MLSPTAALTVLGLKTNWPPWPSVTIWLAACAIDAPRTRRDAITDFIMLWYYVDWRKMLRRKTKIKNLCGWTGGGCAFFIPFLAGTETSSMDLVSRYYSGDKHRGRINGDGLNVARGETMPRPVRPTLRAPSWNEGWGLCVNFNFARTAKSRQPKAGLALFILDNLRGKMFHMINWKQSSKLFKKLETM